MSTAELRKLTVVFEYCDHIRDRRDDRRDDRNYDRGSRYDDYDRGERRSRFPSSLVSSVVFIFTSFECGFHLHSFRVYFHLHSFRMWFSS